MEDNIIHRVVEELELSSDYQQRRADVLAFNRAHKVLKKGIALSPVKFGISFTATWHNQAGALVHVYRDGSIHLSHGGTEMGQGLHIKVAQVVADAFGVTVDHVKITASNTGKVPNTSATAASSGTDLNGMAALDACNQIKARMEAHAARIYEVEPKDVRWEFGGLRAGQQLIEFGELATSCWMNRVQLSAAGFYSTPKIHWGSGEWQGPAVLLLRLWRLVLGSHHRHADRRSTRSTGSMWSRMSAARSIRRSICGQVEGGFIQGVGWLTTEELWWDAKGPAAHACALHLQDPARLRRAARIQRLAGRLVG